MAKLWPVEEAERIIKNLSPDTKTVVFQTGFGPSGLPHIGTFGEVSRTTFVRKAFNRLSSIPTRLISFCDDMDGLRKVPLNIPNQDETAKHLGKPLVKIPDPYGCCESFAHHMENKLKVFLDSFGFDYDFKSSAEQYASGTFNQGLKNALADAEKIRNIMIPTMQKENRESWSPFMPICAACGKNLTTRVTGYFPEKDEIEYSCDTTVSGAVTGCGHKARTTVLNGAVKLGWKADWALRWYAFGVHYEMYGKDLIESYAVSKKIVSVLGGRAPEHYFFELFLDEAGAKISKSVGKGLTVDTWMDYAPLESLEYFMFQNPRKAKKFHFDVIPKTVDEYLQFLRGYYKQDEASKSDNPLTYIHDDLDSKKIFDSDITYSLINNLVSALGTQDSSIVMDYICNYDPAALDYAEFISNLIQRSIAYYRDNILPNKKYKTPDAVEKKLLGSLADKIKAEPGNDAEILQSHVFDVAKENEIAPKDFFLLIYEVLFGQTIGPKVGSFIKLIGKDEFIKRLSEKLS
ncbi:MAG: lysine--tRNA ligase [Spirochaetaceae bacterium]|nr:MAG: lysine--tRNA ligase [Spirochaetaceae bacterium]